MLEMKHTSCRYQDYESTISRSNPNNIILGTHTFLKRNTQVEGIMSMNQLSPKETITMCNNTNCRIEIPN